MRGIPGSKPFPHRQIPVELCVAIAGCAPMCCATNVVFFLWLTGPNWKRKNLKFDTSGGLIQFRFRYAENTHALLPAKCLSPKFSVSISGGAAADFVAHFSGKHQRDHFLVCPPRPQRMLKRDWPVALRRSLRKSVILSRPKCPLLTCPTHTTHLGVMNSPQRR